MTQLAGTASKEQAARAARVKADGRAATRLLANLSSIVRLVNSGRDPQDILNRIAYSVCNNSPWASSSIMAIDRSRSLSVEAAYFDRRYPNDAVGERAWSLSHSPTVEVLQTGRPVIIADALQDKKYIEYWTDAQVRRFRTVILLPLNVDDEAGRPMILSLHASEKIKVSDDDVTFLISVADLLGIAVQKGIRLKSERIANDQLQRSLSLHRNLVDRALGESSLDSVVVIGRQFLELPFVVVDLMTGRALSAGVPASVEMSDAAFSEFLKSDGWGDLTDLLRTLPSAHFMQTRTLSFAVGASRVEMPAYVEPVIVNGAAVGGLIVFPPSTAVNEFSLHAAEAIWTYLSIVLLRSHIRFDGDADLSSELVTRLVEGNISDPAAFLDRAKERGLHLDQPYRILLVAAYSDKSAQMALRWSIGKLCRQTRPHAVSGMVGDLHALMLPESGQIAVTLPVLIDHISQETRRVTGRKPIIADSGVCRSLSDYARSWRRLARTVAWAKDAGFEGHVRAADVGSIVLLADVADHHLSREFVERILRPLRAYDAKRSNPLMPTMVALLKSGGRLQPAANELRVHLTTVRYRVQRIKDLFGIDMSDGDTRFQLELAMRLERLLTPSHR